MTGETKSEQMRVLDLLESGTITADQAAELLQAIGEKPVTAETDWNRAFNIPDGAERERPGQGKIRAASAVKDLIKGLVSALPGGRGGGEERRTLKETASGSLADRSDILIQNKRGHISIEAWERDHFSLEMKLDYPPARYGEEPALGDLVQMDVRPGRLSVQPRSGVHLHLRARLPAQIHELHVTSKYGAVTAASIAADCVRAETKYGRIRFNGLHAAVAEVVGKYGAISGSLHTGSLNVLTKYGATLLTVLPTQKETPVSVRSKYGKIGLALPASCRYELHARTGARVHIGLQVDERRGSPKKGGEVVAVGGDDEAPTGAIVHLQNKYGRIDITEAKEELADATRGSDAHPTDA